ncbi:MAG: hypothetical protein JWN78_1897 [Bacteroidota bacterium]|nr:hypothetical protein [Bacteroidota bacterium]
MKKLSKLLIVLGLIVTTNTYAEELGLKLSNLNLGPAAKGKDKGGSGDGIHKGLIQFDASFTLGGHGAVAPATSTGFGVAPGAMFNVDVAVHPYASVGGYFGIFGEIGGGRGLGVTVNTGGVGIGVGARGVFHIYQLIADKTNTKVDASKLDFYFPLHMGVLIGTAGGTRAGFAIGAGLGVRYYFTDMIGIMSEVGWLETSVFKVGLAMKFK